MTILGQQFFKGKIEPRKVTHLLRSLLRKNSNNRRKRVRKERRKKQKNRRKLQRWIQSRRPASKESGMP